MLWGKDIGRYKTHWRNKWLIDVHNGYDLVPPVEIDKYMEIKKHLDSYYPTLENRQDKGSTPYHLRSCAYHAEFQKEKIVCSDISTEPNFAQVTGKMMINNTAYMITGSRQRYLLGILNSSITNFYISKTATSLGTKGYRYFKIFLEKIPVPEFTSANSSLILQIEDIVRIISSLDYTVDDKQMKKIEDELNDLIYKIFKLTKSEIEILKNH